MNADNAKPSGWALIGEALDVLTEIAGVVLVLGLASKAVRALMAPPARPMVGSPLAAIPEPQQASEPALTRAEPVVVQQFHGPDATPAAQEPNATAAEGGEA